MNRLESVHPPRPVQVVTYARLLPLGCFSPVLLIVLGLLFSAAANYLTLHYGVDDTATVINQYTTKDAKGHTGYHVDLEYTVDDVTYHSSQGLSPAEYATLKPNAHVPIRHYRIGPFMNCLRPETGEGVLVGFPLVAAPVVALLPGILFYVFGWPYILHRRLVRDGSVAAGTVTDMVSTRRSPLQCTVSYTYAPPGQPVLSARMDTETACAANLQKGGPAVVLYDPNRPQRSVLYDLAWYRVEGDPAPPPVASVPPGFAQPQGSQVKPVVMVAAIAMMMIGLGTAFKLASHAPPPLPPPAPTRARATVAVAPVASYHFPNLGLAVDQRTLKVLQVDAGSIAARGGLVPGDVIVQVGDATAPDAMLHTLPHARRGPLPLHLQRGGTAVEATLQP